MKKTKEKPKKEKLNLVIGGLVALLFMCGLIGIGIDAYRNRPVPEPNTIPEMIYIRYDDGEFQYEEEGTIVLSDEEEK